MAGDVLLRLAMMTRRTSESSLWRMVQGLKRTVATVEAGSHSPDAGLPAFEEWLQAYRRRLEEFCEGAQRVAVSPGKTNR